MPEQLADWEAAQKEKRAQEMRDGKNKGANAQVPKAQAQWETVKKDVGRGAVAATAVAALTAGTGG